MNKLKPNAVQAKRSECMNKKKRKTTSSFIVKGKVVKDVMRVSFTQTVDVKCKNVSTIRTNVD